MKFRNWIKTEVGKRCLIILMGTCVLAILLFILDAESGLPQNQNGDSVLYRNEYGAGEREEVVEAKVEGVDGKEKITVQLEEREYDEAETEQVLQEAGEKLGAFILGTNSSLDQVRNNLNLITKIPNTSIQVSWEISDYEIMDAIGEIHSDQVAEDGTIITLKALLTYGKIKVVQEIPVSVYPPNLSDREQVKKSLESAVEKQEAAERSERAVILPQEINGKQVSWSSQKQSRGLAILVFGIVISGLVVLADKEKIKQEYQKRKRQMVLDYPNIVNQYTVFLAAGLTAKNAWIRMAEEYERRKDTEGIRYAYEEMLYTLREMQSGRTEAECYERFGARCEIQEYRKLGVLLAQNLKKGSKGLADVLKREAANAFEERKNHAKKLGEEASTKLLLPMVLMLLVVFIVIIVPAFMSVQI